MAYLLRKIQDIDNELNMVYHVMDRKELVKLLGTLINEARAAGRYVHGATSARDAATIFLASKGSDSIEGNKFDWCKYTVGLHIDTLDRMQRRAKASPMRAMVAKKKTFKGLLKIIDSPREG